jgi:riboflavin kinase/FMN adenylyltransferase
MKIYTDIAALPEFKKAVITIGTFDGVHLGHLKLIGQLLNEAETIGGTGVLITFYPHPKQVIVSDKKPIYILNTLSEKSELLEKAGIEQLVVVPFDKAFSEQPAEEYIRHFLVNAFHPHTIIIGYDHRFGKNRTGDYHLLEAYAPEYGYTVKEIPERILKDITISSTRIREALHKGDIEVANSFLGYPYFFNGTVVEGNKLGRTIGFPTANLEMADEDKLIPANGVYTVEVVVGNRERPYHGMMNIGNRPTVGGTHRVIEVNIFNFEEMIYGQNIKVSVTSKIRDEIRFNGLEELKLQLGKDKLHAEKILEQG